MSVKRFKVQGLSARAALHGSESGFTLVELLISILMTSLIVVAIYSIFRVQTHSVKLQESRLEAQEYARSVLDIMIREIRNAGYFPVGACTTTPANTNGIITADSQTFQFVYDANAANGCADTDENVTYAFSTTGCSAGFGNVTRKEGGNAAQSLTDCNVPTDGFTLTYYAQNSTTAMSPIVLANIQRVQVTLTVQSKNPDQQFGGQLNATMTSNADLRNRGLPS